MSTVGTEAAVWSPDGSRIAFSSNTLGFEEMLMQKPTNGQGGEVLLHESKVGRVAPVSWSRDGRFLLFVVVDRKTNSDVWSLTFDGASKPVPFLQSEAAESQAQFSPDAPGAPRWVAFTSNESGRDEVQVRTFPDGRNRIVVSGGGGHSPKWRRDAKELFYISADGKVMAVPISDNPLRAGAAVPLFQAPRGFGILDATGRRGSAAWDVAPDGQRFLLASPPEGGNHSQFTVVVNWRQGLEGK